MIRLGKSSNVCEGYAILPLIHDWIFKMNVPGVTSIVKLLWKGFSNKNTYSIGCFQHLLFVPAVLLWSNQTLLFVPNFKKRLFLWTLLFVTATLAESFYYFNYGLSIITSQCWTVGTIFAFGRSQMFGPDKLRPLAVGRSQCLGIKKRKTYVLISTHLPK